MNKVYNYLGLFRNFCLRNFFGGMYDWYYGTNEDELRKKHFYENFVKNAIFEEGNELHELAIQPIECKNSENFVKVFAVRIYEYLKRCEDNYIILGNSYDYDYPNPNFKVVKDAATVLNVLRRHFTAVKYHFFDMDSKYYSISNIIYNPAITWDFIDNSLINDRLAFKDSFPSMCSRILTYEFRNGSIKQFISWLNKYPQPADSMMIMSQNSIDALFSFLKDGKIEHKIYERKRAIKVQFKYCVEISKQSCSKCDVTLSFKRNNGNYYSIVIAIVKSTTYNYYDGKEANTEESVYCIPKYEEAFTTSTAYKGFNVKPFSIDKLIIFE